MGAKNSHQPVSWYGPHPQTAEGAQERMKPLIDFLISRFTTYFNEATNFFGMTDEQLLLELFYYQILVNDVAVLFARFGEDQVQQEVLFRMETLRLLVDMMRYRMTLATRQRSIVIRVFGGVAIGGGVALGLVAITPVALAGLGFTPSGVAAGSWAAAIQSTIYGASTTGLFSVAQSVGALGGLSAGATAVTVTTGVSVGALTGGVTAPNENSVSSTNSVVATRQLMFSWESNMEIDELFAKWKLILENTMDRN